MSYILDALKKSEAERQQQNAPGVASVPDRRHRRTAPAWLWILGTLLIANAGALLMVLLRPEPSPPPAAQPAALAADREAGIASEGRRTPNAATEPPGAGSALTEPAPREPGQNVTDAATPRNSGDRTAAAAVGDPPSVPAVPSLMELRAGGELQLPELHLDIHVYSDRPADRFVFVNMSKYRERDRLEEGPLVREIRADGVLLEHNGTTFLLRSE